MSAPNQPRSIRKWSQTTTWSTTASFASPRDLRVIPLLSRDREEDWGRTTTTHSIASKKISRRGGYPHGPTERSRRVISLPRETTCPYAHRRTRHLRRRHRAQWRRLVRNGGRPSRPAHTRGSTVS